MVKCVNTRQPAFPDCGFPGAPGSLQAAANTTKKEETEGGRRSPRPASGRQACPHRAGRAPGRQLQAACPPEV